MSEAAASPEIPPSRPPRRSGVVVPARAGPGARLAARLIWLAVHAVDATLRYDLQTDQAAWTTMRRGRAIFAVWHNRLALSLRLYARFIQKHDPPRRLAAMVSASRDGGLLAQVLTLFGVQPVRGSSSRRGAQALLEMTTWAERGYDLAITPDGPRGPRYQVQAGAVDLAALCGLPLIPVSYDLTQAWRLHSWDGFLVPLPFSLCRVRFGEPLEVPRAPDDAARETYRAEFERRLRAITDQPA
jgi:lysophospholipid acyltransferase (LPLAT)-like uncharacterized protein